MPSMQKLCLKTTESLRDLTVIKRSPVTLALEAPTEITAQISITTFDLKLPTPNDRAQNDEAKEQRNNNRRNKPVPDAGWCLKRHNNLPHTHIVVNCGVDFCKD